MYDVANKLRALGGEVAEAAAEEIERAHQWRDDDTMLIEKLGAEVARLRLCCWEWRLTAETLESALRLCMPIIEDPAAHALHAEALAGFEAVRGDA